MSSGRPSSGVKNLRALFEGQDTSSGPNNTNEEGANTSEHNERRKTKVRASFIPVESPQRMSANVTPEAKTETQTVNSYKSKDSIHDDTSNHVDKVTLPETKEQVSQEAVKADGSVEKDNVQSPSAKSEENDTMSTGVSAPQKAPIPGSEKPVAPADKDIEERRPTDMINEAANKVITPAAKAKPSSSALLSQKDPARSSATEKGSRIGRSLGGRPLSGRFSTDTSSPVAVRNVSARGTPSKLPGAAATKTNAGSMNESIPLEQRNENTQRSPSARSTGSGSGSHHIEKRQNTETLPFSDEVTMQTASSRARQHLPVSHTASTSTSSTRNSLGASRSVTTAAKADGLKRSNSAAIRPISSRPTSNVGLFERLSRPTASTLSKQHEKIDTHESQKHEPPSKSRQVVNAVKRVLPGSTAEPKIKNNSDLKTATTPQGDSNNDGAAINDEKLADASGPSSLSEEPKTEVAGSVPGSQGKENQSITQDKVKQDMNSSNINTEDVKQAKSGSEVSANADVRTENVDV